MWATLALRTRGLIVIAIPSVILLAAIVAVYVADAAEARADEAVIHSVQVRTDIERTLALMDRAETSVRSYLLVRRPEFMSDYAQARTAIGEVLQRLHGLLAADPSRAERLRSVEALIVDRLKALDIAGRTADEDGRFRDRSLRTGQAVLESLRGTLGFMRESVERDIAAQTAAAGRLSTLVRRLLLVGGLTGIGGGILAALLFTGGIGTRMQVLRDTATELRHARDVADAANRAKSEFLSRVSHELRTPMNSILGFGQILQMGRLDDDSADSVAHIVRACRHLLRLIDEVLEISRIEAGAMTMSPEPVMAADVLRETIDLVNPIANPRQVTISEIDRDCEGIYVRADRQRLAQVLLNLLSNAVKFNRQGGRVDVTTAVGQRTLRIAVHDTGCGIAPADIQRAFEPFERLTADASGVEGTGLGLSIARRLVEAMDGRIGAESEPGVGSVFWIELPLAAAPEAPAVDQVAAPQHAAVAGDLHRVLYVEDNLANLRLMERIVGSRSDLALIPAMQGQMGLELARTHRPDLVLLDLNLPDMHGTEVLRLLRLDPATAEIPVIIITADATRSQLDRLVAIGADSYLTKPIDVQRLLETMDGLLQRGNLSGLSVKSASTPSSPR